MDQADDKTAKGLEGVAAAVRQAPGRGPAPVHLWNPEHCGDIDIVIRRDGVWMHEGAPIGRPELVRLFSTILRKDPDGYHLVTPGEKMRIEVEDLPFRAVAVENRGGALVFTTDVGDEVTADNDHPVVVKADAATGEPQPAVRVRGDLWARIARPVFYELVEMAQATPQGLVVRSGEAAFLLGEV